MGLTSSLHIGRSALTSSQLALQVTGNNIANVGTQGYHRQRITFASSAGSDRFGQLFVGRGVSVEDIRRAIDPALQARLRNSTSSQEEAGVAQSVLGQIETLLNELTGNDLSSEMGKFFNAFSELANNPSALSNRGTVVEQGSALASFVQRLHGDLISLRKQVDDQLATNVRRADVLLEQIASINETVSNAELGAGEDGNLRDQRDALIDELSTLMDVTVIERDSGVVDVLVESQPVVTGSRSRGMDIEFVTIGSTVEARVKTKTDVEQLDIQSGAIGGLLAQRGASVQKTLDDLDSLTASLIFEVNRLHSVGRPEARLTDVTGSLALAPADVSLALNDPTNGTLSALPFGPTTGSVEVVLTDADGNQSRTTIQIDLDGIDATGAPGFGNDTSLTDLVTQLDAIANLNAQVTPDGRLRLTTAAGFDVSFGEDTSGVMATLGVNSFFNGTKAQDVSIDAALRLDPLRMSVGLDDGSNETALAIAGLRESGLSALSGDSLSDAWQKVVERTAVEASSAATRATATSAVHDSLSAQQAAVSGVSLDDESINLIAFQQQYAGAARFISLINDLTQILLGLV